MKSNEGIFRIEKMAQILEVSRSGYYDWRKRPSSRRKKEDATYLKEIKEIFVASKYSYGAKKIAKILRKLHEKPVNHKRVERLMRENGLCSKLRKKYVATTNSKHSNSISPNLLQRNFFAEEKNQKMVSDTTYVWTQEGWLYVAAIMDLYGKKIVGLAASKHNDKALVIAALKDVENRVGKKNLKNCILHSDRGSTYTSEDYLKRLEGNGMKCSMSRKGDCWDNAPIESFWGKMKMEWFDAYCDTREEAINMVYEYVWAFYNRQRPHQSNHYLTPEEYYNSTQNAA
ncbi:MAG: IS3 family transposase [Gallicola sp.]|nr:IS3 family transposase [Gallicola sp.]